MRYEAEFRWVGAASGSNLTLGPRRVMAAHDLKSVTR